MIFLVYNISSPISYKISLFIFIYTDIAAEPTSLIYYILSAEESNNLHIIGLLYYFLCD